MPLSENEQKLLEQMERALYAEDPRFASQMRGSSASTPSRKRLILGGLAAVAGLGLVVAGVATSLIWLGVVGFVLMVAGVAWALMPTGKSGEKNTGTKAASGSSRAKRSKAHPAGSSFSERMEDRWEKRRREGGL